MNPFAVSLTHTPPRTPSAYSEAQLSNAQVNREHGWGSADIAEFDNRTRPLRECGTHPLPVRPVPDQGPAPGGTSRAICLPRLAAGFVFAASFGAMATADAWPDAPNELTITEDKDGILLNYSNTWTAAIGPMPYVFHTSRGDLTVLLTRTPNDKCPQPCPDLLEIVSTPPGTVAVPSIVELDELGDFQVRILEWSGM